MTQASRCILILGLVAAAVLPAAAAPRARAQDVEITGPLAGAPAVRKMRIYRDGRFQLQPTVGFTLQDELSRTILTGLQAQYHFTDWIGVGAFFDYGAVSYNTYLADQVEKFAPTTQANQLSLPSAGNFGDQIGRLNYLTGAQVTFIPLRGKLGLFQALFVDTDFYLFGGVALAEVEERADLVGDAATICRNAPSDMRVEACHQTARQTRIAVAPTFGLGVSVYLTNYMGLTLEYRAFPFKWNTTGTDEGGMAKNRSSDSKGEFPDGEIDSSDRIFHFNQMFSLGLAFYLPWQGEVTK